MSVCTEWVCIKVCGAFKSCIVLPDTEGKLPKGKEHVCTQ